ncbi:MAG: XRE family transcriptional regulator [Melioribacteraceae bacterium]|nr:XRE family transcriptional regulator [Melioribacteraceae bacterium]
MYGKRIKQFRLAKGFSLDQLAMAMNGIVSKNALSKYERDLIKPSVKVMTAIAKALSVKTIDILTVPETSIEFVAYRKTAKLPKKSQDYVENIIKTKLEERIKIQELLYHSSKPNLPIKYYNINRIEEVEQAALDLRAKWKLGLDPISNLTELLENNFINVIFIDSEKSFVGISAYAYTNDSHIKSAAVVSKKNISGERQRLNLAHELGHLVLNISSNIDEEKVAFRFGGAFLSPSDTVLKLVGSKRANFQLRELLILKKTFGISLQALLYRLLDLKIITPNSFSGWYKLINKNNWKKSEPMPMKEEKSQWFEKSVLHAYSEGMISSEETKKLLGDEFHPLKSSLEKKREFLKLPKEVRGKLLKEQAERFIEVYEKDDEWRHFGGGIIEY